MVVTRLQKKKEEFRQLRTTQATALVKWIEDGEENDDYDKGPEWRMIIHPRRIQAIPQCLRDIAQDSIRHHDVMNFDGTEGCYGWQWINVVARICNDLNIDVTYKGCLGRGETQHRFGCAAYAALHEYVKSLN